MTIRVVRLPPTLERCRERLSGTRAARCGATICMRFPTAAATDSADVGGGGSLSDYAVRLRREGMHRGIFHGREVVIISDGSKWIENSASAVFAGMDQTFILDQFHVLEKLSDTLIEMLSDEARRKAAYKRLKKLVMDGKASQVIGELAPEASRHDKVAEFIGYCRSNLHRMRYDEYRRRGIPVGSGIIEGGCKHVVVDCLKKSDSHWSRARTAA